MMTVKCLKQSINSQIALTNTEYIKKRNVSIWDQKQKSIYWFMLLFTFKNGISFVFQKDEKKM